jgi:hypothetical protein
MLSLLKKAVKLSFTLFINNLIKVLAIKLNKSSLFNISKLKLIVFLL